MFVDAVVVVGKTISNEEHFFRRYFLRPEGSEERVDNLTVNPVLYRLPMLGDVGRKTDQSDKGTGLIELKFSV